MSSKKSIPIYLSADEVRSMIEACTSNRNKAMIIILYKTGLRCHELSSLKIEHLDIENHMINVQSGKGNKDRDVFLPGDLINVLTPLIARRKTGILFRSAKATEGERVIDRNGRKIVLESYQMNDSTIQGIVRTAAKDAGIVKAKPVTTHTIRHTFACQSLLNGVPLTSVQMALGHSSLKTTEIYLKAIQTKKQLKADYGNHPLPL